MRSPSYRQADMDVEFLNLDETRGVRLQIDYQKPEYLLEQHGIRHTIVVFGSTRIKESAVIRQRVEALRAELREHPESTELQRRLSVAERLMAKTRYYDIARELGRLVRQPTRRRVRRFTQAVTLAAWLRREQVAHLHAAWAHTPASVARTGEL